MSGFNDYAATVAAGIQQGAADVGRSAVADIGDSYQEVLMGNASISPADSMPTTIDNATASAGPEMPTAMPEPEPAPKMPERELDIE